MKLWLVTAGWMDYGDSGTDRIVGVFDDEAMADDVRVVAESTYDYARVEPVDVNCVLSTATREISHYRRYINNHKEIA